MSRIVLVAALLAAACSAREPQPAPSPSAASNARAGLPADVIAFRQKRDACDQLRGEEPYDHARAVQLAREMKATCTGTDAALAALRRHYRGDAAATAALAGYDDRVE